MTRNIPAKTGRAAEARNPTAPKPGECRTRPFWYGVLRSLSHGALRLRTLSRGTLCALCLLLGAALLAACTPGAPGVPGNSGTPGAETPLSDSNDIPAHGKDAPVIDLPALPADTASSLGDGEDICRLPLAPDTGTEFPEPDRAAVLTDGTVALYLDAREFVLGTDDAIGYTIENTTGHSVYVVFAPRLERWTDGVWEWVPGSGFGCGMPDPVDETYSDSLPLEWFSGLTEGVYRLSYTLYDSDMTRLLSDEPAFSACFFLTGENS